MSNPTRIINGIEYVRADYHEERVKVFRDKWNQAEKQSKESISALIESLVKEKRMNTTSLEVSKKLYEVSGWGKDLEWRSRTGTTSGAYPAYPLGFLIRKLPAPELGQSVGGVTWFAYAKVPRKIVGGIQRFEAEADSPEDAAALLLIKLIESRVINI